MSEISVLECALEGTWEGEEGYREGEVGAEPNMSSRVSFCGGVSGRGRGVMV